MIIKPSIEKFFTKTQALGFGKKYNFQVESIDGIPVNLNSDYFLYAQSLRLPTRRINTTNVPYKAFEFVVPTNASYTDNSNWSLTFFSDNQSLIRTVFEEWSKIIYNEQTQKTQNVDFASCKIVFNLLPDVVENTANDQINLKQYTIEGAFPTLLDGIEYNITNTGTEVITFTVTFAYQYFTTKLKPLKAD